MYSDDEDICRAVFLGTVIKWEFSKRAANAVEWEGAHSPFLSRPHQVIELLTDIAG